MEVPTEDEAAAAEKAPVKKTATVASGGKKAPVENLVTGEKAVASKKGASVENVVAVAPSGRKAPSGKKGTVEASGGKKVPRGKKAPVQSAVVGEKGVEEKDDADNICSKGAAKKVSRSNNNNNREEESPAEAAKKVTRSNNNNNREEEKVDVDNNNNVVVEKQKKTKNTVMASADNQTVLLDSELEQEDEKSDEEGQQLHRPSNVVVVRDGGKVLVPVSSLKSTEKKATDIDDFAVATRLRSKDKEVQKSQKAKGGKQPAVAAVQKGTPGAAAPKSPKNNTPTATSGQTRTSPRKSSSGKRLLLQQLLAQLKRLLLKVLEHRRVLPQILPLEKGLHKAKIAVLLQVVLRRKGRERLQMIISLPRRRKLRYHLVPYHQMLRMMTLLN
jgi:hypothetical protein